MPGTTGASCRYRSEIVPISRFHAMTPSSSAPLRVFVPGCGRRAWKEKQSAAFRTQPSAEEKLPGADQERKSPDMGTELSPRSKAGQSGLGISHSPCPTEMGLLQFGTMGRQTQRGKQLFILSQCLPNLGSLCSAPQQPQP